MAVDLRPGARVRRGCFEGVVRAVQRHELKVYFPSLHVARLLDVENVTLARSTTNEKELQQCQSQSQ